MERKLFENLNVLSSDTMSAAPTAIAPTAIAATVSDVPSHRMLDPISGSIFDEQPFDSNQKVTVSLDVDIYVQLWQMPEIQEATESLDHIDKAVANEIFSLFDMGKTAFSLSQVAKRVYGKTADQKLTAKQLDKVQHSIDKMRVTLIRLDLTNQYNGRLWKAKQTDMRTGFSDATTINADYTCIRSDPYAKATKFIVEDNFFHLVKFDTTTHGHDTVAYQLLHLPILWAYARNIAEQYCTIPPALALNAADTTPAISSTELAVLGKAFLEEHVGKIHCALKKGTEPELAIELAEYYMYIGLQRNARNSFDKTKTRQARSRLEKILDSYKAGGFISDYEKLMNTSLKGTRGKGVRGYVVRVDPAACTDFTGAPLLPKKEDAATAHMRAKTM